MERGSLISGVVAVTCANRPSRRISGICVSGIVSVGVGEFVTQAVPSLSLVTSSGAVNPGFMTAAVLGEVEAAVSLEIETVGDHGRPGLAAAALALARILDNPKAVSTQPAAAAKLANLLETLRKSSVNKLKLAAVRRLTNPRTPN